MRQAQPLELSKGGQYSGEVVLAASLRTCGVSHTFGIPGFRNIRLYEALARGFAEPVLVTNEQSAGYAAIGVALCSGRIGCLNLIGGPGVTHALPGIDQAHRDGVPILVLCTGKDLRAGDFQLHDVDNLGLLKPFCKETHRLGAQEDISTVVAALTECALQPAQGPCALEIPANLLSKKHVFTGERPKAASFVAGSQLSRQALSADALPRYGWLEELWARLAQRDPFLIVDVAGWERPLSASGAGLAIPTAVGVALCKRLPLAVTHAGSLLSTGQELATAVARQLPLVVVVPRDTAEPFAARAFASFVGVPYLELSGGRLAEVEDLIDRRLPVLCETEVGGQAPSRRARRSGSAKTSYPGVALLTEALRAAPTGPVVAARLTAEQPAVRALAASGLEVRETIDAQSASFIADGYARSAGRPAVLLLSDRHPTTSVLSGVGECYLDQVPLVLLMLTTTRTAEWRELTSHLCKSVTVATSAADLRDALARAARDSQAAPPGPCAVLIAEALLEQADPQKRVPVGDAPTARALKAGGRGDSGAVHSVPPPKENAVARLGVTTGDVDAVATMLLRAKAPLLFIGQGCLDCGAEIIRLAESAGMMVASTLAAKGIFPEDHPNWLWAGFGPALPQPLRPLFEACDAALIVGARMGELATVHYRAAFPRQCFHVDVDPRVPNRNVAATPIVCPARDFLTALLEHIAARDLQLLAKGGADLQGALRRGHEAVRAAAARQPGAESQGLSPYVVFETVQSALPAETTFTVDSGNGCIFAAEALRLSRPRRFLAPTDYNSMGYAVPAAVGAAWADGARPVVAFVGDGAFLMTGLKTLASARETPTITIILRDGKLGMIHDMQLGLGLEAACTILPPFSAEAGVGVADLRFQRVSTREELASAVRDALAAWQGRRSTLIECPVDYRVRSHFSMGVTAAPPVPRPQATQSAPGAGLSLGSSYPEHPDIWGVLRQANERFPERVATSEAGARLSYRQLYERSCRLAASLASRGFRRGDVLGVMMPNSVKVIESHFAVAGLGGVLLNVNTRLTPPELAHIFKDAGVRWLIAAPEYERTLAEAVEACGIQLEGVLWSRGADVLPRHSSFGASHRYDAMLESEPLFEPAVDAEHLPFLMYYTSGTTGFPKGVALTQRQVFLHAIGAGEEMRLGARDVWGHFSPMFHPVDAFAIYAVTWVGGRHVIFHEPDPAALLPLIEREAVTSTNIAAALAPILLNHPRVHDYRYDSLRILSCGGSALNRKLILEFIRLFNCEFFVSYGMTECCGKISMSLLTDEQRQRLSADEQLDLVASSGRPFKLMEVRIVDAEGRDVPKDAKTVGEIWIKGETVFAGYHRQPAATKEAFQDGWFKTGDLAVWREDGYLTLVDRKNDMILFCGENVYAQEVERVIAMHPDVRQVVVYGVPHETAGEMVKAVVVPSRQGALTAESITSFSRRHLAAYKIPQLVEFIAEMPMTGSGKINRRAVKDRETRRGPGAARPSAQQPARGRAALSLTECQEKVLAVVEQLVPDSRAAQAIDLSLWEVGLDSILFITLLAKLREELGLPLRPDFLFQHNSVREIAEYVHAHQDEGQTTEPGQPGTAARSHAAGTQQFEGMADGWSVGRELGHIERALFLLNEAGFLHLQPVLELEGTVDPALMRRAVELLELRFPVLRTRVLRVDGRPRFEYAPGQHLEVEFLQGPEFYEPHRVLASQVNDLNRKKLFFIRSPKEPAAFKVVSCIGHFFMEVHSVLRLFYNLLDIHSRLARGQDVDVAPFALPLSVEECLTRRSPVTQEAIDEYFSRDAYRLPHNPFAFSPERMALDTQWRLDSECRTVTLDSGETQGLLRAASDRGSSVSGVLAAALCLAVKRTFTLTGTGGDEAFAVRSPLNVRPVLGLDNDLLGYFALYPKFRARLDAASDFFGLARHFHQENQSFFQRDYPKLQMGRQLERLAGCIELLATDRQKGNRLVTDTLDRLIKLFVINLGVLESRIGDDFRVRNFEVLQCFPNTITTYAYILDGRLNCFFSSSNDTATTEALVKTMTGMVRQSAVA